MNRCIVFRLVTEAVIFGALAVSLSGASESPRNVLERFCELDAKGEQLSASGWSDISRLFVSPGASPRQEMIVIRDFVVSRPNLNGNRAEFYVEYIQLGKINYSDGKFSHLPPLKVRAAFTVVFMDEHSGAQQTGAGGERARWLIEGSPPEPHVTVASGLEYVTGLQYKTKDVLTKKNTQKAITALQNLRGATSNSRSNIK